MVPVSVAGIKKTHNALQGFDSIILRAIVVTTIFFSNLHKHNFEFKNVYSGSKGHCKKLLFHRKIFFNHWSLIYWANQSLLCVEWPQTKLGWVAVIQHIRFSLLCHSPRQFYQGQSRVGCRGRRRKSLRRFPGSCPGTFHRRKPPELDLVHKVTVFSL